MSQRVDQNGIPSVGWLLYIYASNSSTPTQSYQDFGLTVLNTWPIIADANGMMKPFWLPDGTYRARATSNDGSIIYFDLQSVTAVGASTGMAPSGGVDPTAIFQTGDLIWLDATGTRSGWVRDNGRTIGSATSGATERGNADAQVLFQFLWNNFADAICPVVGGRGASSLTDWTANKQITLPDKRGYVPGGLDDMGNAAAGRYGTAPIIAGSVTTAGGKVGEAAHTDVTAEMPAHTHGVVFTDAGHSHATSFGPVNLNITGGGGGFGPSPDTAYNSAHSQSPTNVQPTGITAVTDSQGGGTAHNNVQLTVLGTFFRKL